MTSQTGRIRWLALAGALLTGAGTVFVYRNFTPFALLTAGLSIGLLAYALLGPETDGWVEVAGTDPRLPGVLAAAFFVATAVSALSLTEAYYSKSLLYYVAVAVSGGAVLLRALLTDAHRSSAALAFLYGLNTFASNQVAFPLGLNGPDIGHHVGLATTIAETGRVVGGGTYNGFPAHHLLAATGAVLTGQPVPPTYRTIGMLGMLLGLPLIYLVAKRIGGSRFAVVAMLFYGSRDYVVYRAGHPSKLAYALPVVFLLFASLIYLYRDRRPGFVGLFGFFSVVLVFTHHHTSFQVLVMLGSLALGWRLAPHLGRLLGPVTAGTPDEGANGGRRGHVFMLLFAVAFLAQFMYFSGMFENLVEIANRYVETLFVAGGEEAVKQTPRFSSIPMSQLLINTVGSGALAFLATLGGLHHLERRDAIYTGLIAWFFAAGGLMVLGVVADVPFALPQRVYVVAEITVLGLLGASGLLYLLDRVTPRTGARAAALSVAALFVAFALFSTGSTIAGMETSPFNEDVPHRTWYGMTEENTAETFLSDVGATESFRWSRSLDVTLNGTIRYSEESDGALVGLNHHKLSKGIVASGGQGRIGTGIYVTPKDPAAGLERSSKVYDNGVVDVYRYGGRP